MLSLQGFLAFFGLIFTFLVMNKLQNAKRVPLDFPLAGFLWRLTDGLAYSGLFVTWFLLLLAAQALGKVLGFLPILALPVYFGFLLKKLESFERDYEESAQ